MPAEYGHRIAGFHSYFLLPSGSIQHVGRIPFELPVGCVALVVFYVHKEVAVGIHPFDFGDDARECNGLGGVVFRAEGMVSKQGSNSQKQQAPEKTGMNSVVPHTHFSLASRLKSLGRTV